MSRIAPNTIANFDALPAVCMSLASSLLIITIINYYICLHVAGQSYAAQYGDTSHPFVWEYLRAKTLKRTLFFFSSSVSLADSIYIYIYLYIYFIYLFIYIYT